MAYLAAVVAALIAVMLAPTARAFRSKFVTQTSTNVMLNIDPSFHWLPAISERTFSAEGALQAAGLFYGQYASMAQYRFAGFPGNISAGNMELDLASSAVTSATNMGLNTRAFTRDLTKTEDADFTEFVRSELNSGNPILVGMFKRMALEDVVYGNASYDHVNLIIGYSSDNASHFEIHHLDLFRDAVSTLADPSAPVFQTRDQMIGPARPTPPYTYAVPSTGIVAFAVTGVNGDGSYEGQDARIVANVTMFDEPRWLGTTISPSTIPVALSISNLVPNRFYELLGFTTNTSVPSSPYASSPNRATTYQFRAASSGTLFLPAAATTLSSELVLFRIVLIDDPPATPIPEATVPRSDTCPGISPGIYDFNEINRECRGFRKCREDLCNCLGVGEGDKCWLRSLKPCDEFEQCFALATHCVESVARLSTDSGRCEILRETYTNALPGITQEYSNNDRTYRESLLGQQCRAFMCEAYRLYFPSNTRCSLNYNVHCDLPLDIHYTLMVDSSVSFESIVSSSAVRAPFKASLKQDLDQLLTLGRSVTILSVVGRGTALIAGFRVEGSAETSNMTAFEAAVGANSNWLVNTRTTFTNSGGSGQLTVSLTVTAQPDLGSGLNDFIDNCDNTCVVVISLAVIFVIILCMCFVACIVQYSSKKRDTDGASSMSAAVRKVMDRRKQREQAQRAEDEARAAEDTQLTNNEPTEL